MASEKFNLVIVDEGDKLFNVLTDLYSDELHIQLIHEANQVGRSLRCFNPNTNNMDQILDEMVEMGYQYTTKKLLPSSI